MSLKDSIQRQLYQLYQYLKTVSHVLRAFRDGRRGFGDEGGDAECLALILPQIKRVSAGPGGAWITKARFLPRVRIKS